MRNTTLIYIRQNDNYLMLHRTKKKNDQSHDKWLGIGGKFEDKESPEDCILRETKEETGLTLTHYKYRGIVTFVSDVWETEYMHLFTADGFTGELIDCDEETSNGFRASSCCLCPPGKGTKFFSSCCLTKHSRFSRSSLSMREIRWYSHPKMAYSCRCPLLTERGKWFNHCLWLVRPLKGLCIRRTSL